MQLAHCSAAVSMFLGQTDTMTVQKALRRVIAPDCMVTPCTWGWQQF